jgi:hypothetical protein
VLKTATDSEFILSCLDATRDKIERLLPRATEAIDCGSRNCEGPASREHARASYAPALLKSLCNASNEHIVDSFRGYLGSRYERVKGIGEKVHGVNC